MAFVETMEDLAEMGFSADDLKSLEKELVEIGLDEIEIWPDAPVGDPIITVFANTYERVNCMKYGGSRMAMYDGYDDEVILHDKEAGLFVKLQYLEDNSYADYDVVIYDEDGYEITTTAGGLGWEDAEDIDEWEPHQEYSFYEVAEVLNAELANCWPTRFDPDRAIIELHDGYRDDLFELFDLHEAEEMEFIRTHTREEVMARREERAMKAALAHGVVLEPGTSTWLDRALGRAPGELKAAGEKPKQPQGEMATPAADGKVCSASAAARGAEAPAKSGPEKKR